MKVKELINALSTFNEDQDVIKEYDEEINFIFEHAGDIMISNVAEEDLDLCL